MAISFVTDLAVAQNTRILSFAFGTLAVGDCIVIPVLTENMSNPEAATPGGATGITWTARQTQATASKCYEKLWTGVVTVAGSKTVTVAGPTSSFHGSVAAVFPAADGYSFAPTPALVGGASTPVNGAASATPTASITTVGPAGSIVYWALADFAARAAAARTYASSATERGFGTNIAWATFYFATQVTTGPGVQTVGLTGGVTGGNTTPSFVGVEILIAGGSTEVEGWGVSI